MEVITIIIIILICVGLFFLCRQLNCWYLKINERIDLMNQMLENQEEIISLLQGKKSNKVTSTGTKESTMSVEGTRKYKEVEESISYEVGDKVHTAIEKYGLATGTIVSIDKVLPEGVLCSLDMRTIGIYSYEEIYR